jgi:gas vesicle protein
MKNIIKNDNRTALLIGIGAVALIAGAATYYFLTEDGEETKQKLNKKVKDQVRDIASKAIAHKTGLSKKLVRKAAEHVG